MPSPSRRTLLIAVAVIVLGVLAAIPAPRLLFRRSPSVAARLRGDVRHVAMVVEPDTGYVHAGLEVWTGSDWDIEYWSSLTPLTPVARLVTNDYVEQRDVSIALNGKRLALTYVTRDLKAGMWMLAVWVKGIRDRSWVQLPNAATSKHEISSPSVAVTANGVPDVTWVVGGALYETKITRPGESHIEFPYAGDKGDAHPSVAVAHDGAVGITFERRNAIMMVSRSATGPWSSVQLAAHGVRPVIRAQGAGFVVAWGEASGSSARLVTRGADGGIQRNSVTAIGTFNPAIAITDAGDAIAGWTDGAGSHWLAGVYQRDDRVRGICCAAVGAGGKHIVEVFLEKQQVKGIYWIAHVSIDGRSVTIPVATR